MGSASLTSAKRSANFVLALTLIVSALPLSFTRRFRRSLGGCQQAVLPSLKPSLQTKACLLLRKLLSPQVHTVKIPKQEPGPSMSPQAWQQYFAARLHRGNTDNAALNEAQKYVRLHVPHHNYGGVTSEYVDDLLSLLPHSLQGTGLQVRTRCLSMHPSMTWDIVWDSQSSRALG